MVIVDNLLYLRIYLKFDIGIKINKIIVYIVNMVIFCKRFRKE